MFSARPSALLMLMTATMVATGCPDPTAGLQPDGQAPVGDQAGPKPAGGQQGATRPDDARFKVAAGEGVEVSGTFVYAGEKTGKYRLDFLSTKENAPPSLVHTLELSAPGPWSVTVPKDYGDLQIVAFIDQKSDGPSSDDPGGRTAEPITVGEEPISGIEINVVDDPELGALTPGGADGPPPAGPEMPEGAANPNDPPPEGGTPPAVPGGRPDGPPSDNTPKLPVPEGD